MSHRRPTLIALCHTGVRRRTAGTGASLPGVRVGLVGVVVGERDEAQAGGGRGRGSGSGGGGGAPRRAPRAQLLLVGRRARLAELVHQREDALHRRLHVAYAARCEYTEYELRHFTTFRYSILVDLRI